eukprot:459058_1
MQQYQLLKRLKTRKKVADIESNSLQRYVETEGKDIWSLKKVCSEQKDSDYEFKCNLCFVFGSQLNRRIHKNEIYQAGQIFTNSQINSSGIFNTKIRYILKHENENKFHSIASNPNKVAPNIHVKSALAYFLFTEAAVDISYTKSLYLFQTISEILDVEIPTGDYGQGKNMITKWRNIYRRYMKINLIFTLKKPNTKFEVRLFSFSCDGVSKGVNMSVEVIVIYTVIGTKQKIFVINLGDFKYSLATPVKKTHHKVSIIHKSLKELGLNPHPNELKEGEATPLCLGNVTDHPYLHENGSRPGTSRFEELIKGEFHDSTHYIKSLYGKEHCREGYRKKSLKASPKVKKFAVIVQKGIVKQNTPKWRSMSISLLPGSKRYKLFSYTRWWGHEAKVYKGVDDNFPVAIKILLMIEQGNKKVQIVRQQWSSIMFVVIHVLMLDFSGMVQVNNDLFQRVVCIFPGEYAYKKIVENKDLITVGHLFPDIKKLLNESKRKQIEPGHDLMKIFEKVKAVLPHFYGALTELFVGKYKDVDLLSQDIFEMAEQKQIEIELTEEEKQCIMNEEKQIDKCIDDEYLPEEDIEYIPEYAWTSEEVSHYKLRAQNTDEKERQVIDDGYSYVKSCSSVCVGQMYQCVASKCQKWVCLYHLKHTHNFPLKDRTVTLSQDENIPDPLNNEHEYKQLCEEDICFNNMEHRTWLCCDCIDLIISSVDIVSTYVDSFRKLAYNTELYFGDDEKVKNQK